MTIDEVSVEVQITEGVSSYVTDDHADKGNTKIGCRLHGLC